VSRRWVTFYVNGGQLTVEREVAPPGTPAGPDPDRAEMLLADALCVAEVAGEFGPMWGRCTWAEARAATAALKLALEDA
jgi:hypothetical protein